MAVKKSIVTFVAAVAISTVAATSHWGDSAHSIGLITKGGGKVRHPASFTAGTGRRMLIATATVIPPYRGDARITVEGDPPMEYQVALSKPIIDLGIRSWPDFRENILYGLEPKDRLAIWVKMYPPAGVDPVCGMKKEAGFITVKNDGRDYHFCSTYCLDRFIEDPRRFKDRHAVRGTYHLALHDTGTGRPVLRVPLIFQGEEEAGDAGGHQH
jgi:YHS domain-containing protein